MDDTVWGTLVVQVVLPVLGIVVTGFIGWVSTALASKAKYQLTVEQQATLHSALMTGLRTALMKGAGSNVAISAAVDYALHKGAPDAITKLGVSMDTLKDMALAKLNILEANGTETNATER